MENERLRAELMELMGPNGMAEEVYEGLNGNTDADYCECSTLPRSVRLVDTHARAFYLQISANRQFLVSHRPSSHQRPLFSLRPPTPLGPNLRLFTTTARPPPLPAQVAFSRRLAARPSSTIGFTAAQSRAAGHTKTTTRSRLQRARQTTKMAMARATYLLLRCSRLRQRSPRAGRGTKRQRQQLMWRRGLGHLQEHLRRGVLRASLRKRPKSRVPRTRATFAPFAVGRTVQSGGRARWAQRRSATLVVCG